MSGVRRLAASDPMTSRNDRKIMIFSDASIRWNSWRMDGLDDGESVDASMLLLLLLLFVSLMNDDDVSVILDELFVSFIIFIV